MAERQTQQPVRVRWDPSDRTGDALDSLPFDGEEWTRVKSDGWHERLDMPGFYQREEVSGLTRPCVLTIRSRDLAPAESAPEKPAQTAGLREDLTHALQAVRDMLQVGPSAEVLKAVERSLMGALAQVAG